jgi:light-regulated signal transduction histidine kinase (bacteriophytochrome)
MLSNSNRKVDTFAYTASHDLQEPLRKIITFGERLKIKFSDKLGDEGIEYADRIIASAQGMKALINSLLTFSEMSKSLRDYEVVALRDIINTVIEDMELKIMETNASITIGPLPEVEVNRFEMSQLFGNLLSNAIKFRLPINDPKIMITGAPIDEAEKKAYPLKGHHGFAKIVVEDEGIGFDEKYAERIFQVFQRLHGKSEYPGSGIGLAICKKIVENHNGYIYAKSEQGHGASFTVILPKKQLY